MKDRLTPVPYPTSSEEEYKWGFDVYKPDRTPMAWLIDWSSPSSGWGISPQQVMEILQFKVDLGFLSGISVDEHIATLSSRLGQMFHGFLKALHDELGIEKTVQIARNMAYPGGEAKWRCIQATFGSPVPLDKIAWYQDLDHLITGPPGRPYAWCDNRKTVVTRLECTERPPQGMEEWARYCRVCDDAFCEGYMVAEPDLLVIRVPDIGDLAEEQRCIHMFTYDREVVETLPDDLKNRIPETTKKVLEAKGIRL